MEKCRDGIRWERPVAAAAAMMITMSGLLALSRVPALPDAPPRRQVGSGTTVLVTLPRTRAAVPSRPTRADGVAVGTARHAARRVPADALDTAASSGDAAPDVATAPVPRRLDLRLPQPPPATTASAPWERTAADDLAAVPVVSVRMQDSSLMGKLSRSGRAMECAELRAALALPSTSADVILASMRKRGCD